LWLEFWKHLNILKAWYYEPHMFGSNENMKIVSSLLDNWNLNNKACSSFAWRAMPKLTWIHLSLWTLSLGFGGQLMSFNTFLSWVFEIR
jgi:hypothetical protein